MHAAARFSNISSCISLASHPPSPRTKPLRPVPRETEVSERDVCMYCTCEMRAVHTCSSRRQAGKIVSKPEVPKACSFSVAPTVIVTCTLPVIHSDQPPRHQNTTKETLPRPWLPRQRWSKRRVFFGAGVCLTRSPCHAGILFRRDTLII